MSFDDDYYNRPRFGDDSWGSNGDDSWGQPGSWGKHAIGDDDWNWDKDVTPKKPTSDEKWDGKHDHKDDSGAYDDAEFRNKNTTYVGSGGKETYLEWSAPDNGKFIANGTSSLDVKQGSYVGDCWFLAALASLATSEKRLHFVIQKKRNEKVKPEQGYVFKFFKMGEWVSYKVDKYLPQITTHSVDNELWVQYCEKAYAKRYETYQNLKGGFGVWGMTDLTGGIALQTELNWDEAGTKELFFWLYENQHEALVTSSVSNDSGEQGEVLKSHGLVGGHAYSVLKIEILKDNKGQTVQLLRIRNPWGNSREWSGDWSDSSHKWDEISAEKRKKLLVKCDDGAFWICYQDWVNNFNAFDVCVLPTKFCDDKKGPRFEHEHHVSGHFQDGTHEIHIKIQVNADNAFVIMQVLLDRLTKEENKEYIKLTIKAANGNYVFPLLPTKYKTNCFERYMHQGYLYNLAKGDYTATLICGMRPLGGKFARGAVDGRKWMIRAVSEDVSLQKMN